MLKSLSETFICDSRRPNNQTIHSSTHDAFSPHSGPHPIQRDPRRLAAVHRLPAVHGQVRLYDLYGHRVSSMGDRVPRWRHPRLPSPPVPERHTDPPTSRHRASPRDCRSPSRGVGRRARGETRPRHTLHTGRVSCSVRTNRPILQA